MVDEKPKVESTQLTVVDEYDYSSLVTDDPDSRNFVESWNRKMIGGDILDELLITPYKTIRESSFIKYVVEYYKNPTDENRLALFDLIKSPKVEIRVVDDNDPKKLLFVMPPIFSDIDTRVKLKDHNSMTSVERLVHNAKHIRERAGSMGDVYFANEAKKLDFKINDTESNRVIAEILHKYGVTIPGFGFDEPQQETPKQITSTTTNDDSGYSDEW